MQSPQQPGATTGAPGQPGASADPNAAPTDPNADPNADPMAQQAGSAQAAAPQHVHNIRVHIHSGTNAGPSTQGAPAAPAAPGMPPTDPTAQGAQPGQAPGGATPAPMPDPASLALPSPTGTPSSSATMRPPVSAPRPQNGALSVAPKAGIPGAPRQPGQPGGQLSPNPTATPVKKKLPRRAPKAPPPPAEVANARARQTNVLKSRQSRELQGRMQGPYRDIDAGMGSWGSALSPLL